MSELASTNRKEILGASRDCFVHRAQIKKPGVTPGFEDSALSNGQADSWMFDACLPLGPWTISKLTFWPSLRVLKPFICIAEK